MAQADSLRVLAGYQPAPRVSCGGLNASGTWRRFTRMRVQVDERPRMESTSTSSMARNPAAWACLLFHLSRPASAAFLSREFATTTSGIFARGGQGASPRPAASSFAARSRVFRANLARRPCCVRIDDFREALRNREYRKVGRVGNPERVLAGCDRIPWSDDKVLKDHHRRGRRGAHFLRTADPASLLDRKPGSELTNRATRRVFDLGVGAAVRVDDRGECTGRQQSAALL